MLYIHVDADTCCHACVHSHPLACAQVHAQSRACLRTHAELTLARGPHIKPASQGLHFRLEKHTAAVSHEKCKHLTDRGDKAINNEYKHGRVASREGLATPPLQRGSIEL